MILLVEPAPMLRRELSRGLYKEVDIATVNDGEEAWEAFNALPEIDLIVTEVAMPFLDGYGLLERIRTCSAPHRRATPVIVLSEADPPEARHQALAAGADDYLVKPIDPAELLLRVRLHQRLGTALRELDETRRALASQATIDPVTRICNRRAFLDQARRDIAFAIRHNTPVSLLLLDIDRFAEINDRWGVEEGDELLATIAAWLTHSVRAEDTVARLEGARFAILAPQAGKLGAAVLAERLRSGLAALTLPIDDEVARVTASLGVTTLHGKTRASIDDLLAIADRRLAAAKGHGRNQVCRTDSADETADMRRAVGVTAPLPETTPRLSPATPEVATGELVEQLLPLLQELSRQLGVDQLIAEPGRPGSPSGP